MPDDGRRYEILDGDLAIGPAPRPWHQTVSIQYALMDAMERPGHGQIFDAPVDVLLSDHDIVQPDLVVLWADQASLVTERAIEGAPAVVIEILSPSTRRRDVLVKSAVYQRCNVPRYWLVDPDLDRVEALVLRGGTCAPEWTPSAPDRAVALLLPDGSPVGLDLGAVFRR